MTQPKVILKAIRLKKKIEELIKILDTLDDSDELMIDTVGIINTLTTYALAKNVFLIKRRIKNDTSKN